MCRATRVGGDWVVRAGDVEEEFPRLRRGLGQCHEAVVPVEAVVFCAAWGRHCVLPYGVRSLRLGREDF